MKGDGGIILGITNSDIALRRWMIAGPEMARLLIIIEYNDNQSKKLNDTERHHEQIPSVQKTFLSHDKNVTEIMEELGNPFADTSADLYSLETKQLMSERLDTLMTVFEKLSPEIYKVKTKTSQPAIYKQSSIDATCCYHFSTIHPRED
ncbi:hypothetical protein RRG08_015514 [Elysia crispata]|uniref:Uncharacterized protein n=1 Tax=Elysia crispata TaxID=231223 RepID=A0AAE1AD19_9GAST|nr:hypothetical protein RRG08_015514 [Elysia crispata]